MAHDRECFAHLRVGDCHIAVPVACTVQAVALPAAGLTLLPRRRGALVGLIERDGGAVPVVALDRWVPMGEPGDPADARIVILRAGQALIAIRADALLGIKPVASSTIRRVHQVADADELFESVVPATADRPLLCLLEVGRLMALVGGWCAEAGIEPVQGRAAASRRRTTSVRHAVLVVGGELLALPVVAVAEMVRTPKIEMRRRGQRVGGICEWNHRKLPIVDLASIRDPGAGVSPWIAVIALGSFAIALAVKRCERFIDLAEEDVALLPGDELLAGSAVVAELGKVSVVDVEKLFRAIPEARISQAPPVTPVSAAVLAAANEAMATADGVSHYLVFEADRLYASPVAGMVGVMALPPSAIDELVAGRRATVVWRERTLNVVNLPPIDGGRHDPEPKLAVILEGPGDDSPWNGIAIRSLTDWLPAHAALRSGLRTHSIGEISMITAQRSGQSMSLVVVDLPQMAYLLS